MTAKKPNLALPLGLALVGLTSLGCRQDMHDQPRYEPLEESTFFADGLASRHPVEGTVARGQLIEDVALATGYDEAGTLVTELPLPLDEPLLRRGRERYDIFCAPCHDRTGAGRGMVVQRGFKQPQTFHQDRLRQAPIGYFYDNIANGFGQMPSYASQIPVRDRWAIAAWVRVLQRAHSARLADLPVQDQEAVARLGEEPAEAAHSEPSSGDHH